jgi:spermidine synthase
VTTGYRTLARRRSGEMRILVREETPGERSLVFEGTNAVQSVARVGAPGYPVLPYVRALAAAVALLPPPRRALVVGLGAGTVPMFLRTAFPDCEVEVVELDPTIVEVAREWFEFADGPHLRVIVGDGRAVLEKARRRWDLVVLDAYGESHIPPHLATREFLAIVQRRLAPGGAVLANLWGSSTNRRYRSMLRTYQEVFDDVWVVRPPHSGNRIVVGLLARATWTRAQAVRAGRELGEAAGLRFDPGALLASGLERLAELVPAAALEDEVSSSGGRRSR